MFKKLSLFLFFSFLIIIFSRFVFGYYEDEYLKNFKELIIKNDLKSIRRILEEDNFILVRKDYNGYNPVIWAIMYNKIDVLKVMSNYFISLNLKDDNNLTPLHWACKLNNFAALKIFLNFYDINAKDIFGNTPLHYSVMNQNLIITNYLLSKGASPYITNVSNLSPIDLSKGNGKILQLFNKFYKSKLKNIQNIQLKELILSNLKQEKYNQDLLSYYSIKIVKINDNEIIINLIKTQDILYKNDIQKEEDYKEDDYKDNFKQAQIIYNLEIKISISKEKLNLEDVDLSNFLYDPILNYYVFDSNGLLFYTYFLDGFYKINIQIANEKLMNNSELDLNQMKKDLLVKLGKYIIEY
jgi:hypothetical protein